MRRTRRSKREPMRLVWVMCLSSLLAFFVPCEAAGEVIFSLDLAFNDEAATRTIVESHGGSITGGIFGSEGWTTTSRDDIILIPLPDGISTDEGRLSLSFKNPEVDMTAEYFEQWVILSLDGRGFPYRMTPAGSAGLQSIYRGYNPDSPDRSYRLVAYCNLHDPACTDWRDCTGEAGTNPDWIRGDDTVFGIAHEWQGPLDRVTFTGRGTLARPIDLTATSPDGLIQEASMVLMINACGGSSIDGCGAWGGPAAMKGGPIGITYIELSLELSDELAEAEEGTPETAPEVPDEADAAEAAPDSFDLPLETPDAQEPRLDGMTDGSPDGADAAEQVDEPDTATSGGCGCRLV